MYVLVQAHPSQSKPGQAHEGEPGMGLRCANEEDEEEKKVSSISLQGFTNDLMLLVPGFSEAHATEASHSGSRSE